MSRSELSLEDVEATFRRRERRALRRTTLLTLIPVLAAAALLWLALDRLNDTNQELKRAQRQLVIVTQQLEEASRERDAAQREARRLRAQLKRDQARLQATREQLRQSARFVGREHPLTAADYKIRSTAIPSAARLFDGIRLRLGAEWGLANTPRGGFTSPGFAGHVLGSLTPGARGGDPERALLRLPRTTEPPFIGDVVLYEGGFAMFFLRDASGRPYVLGMTPVGVLSLEPDFGVRQVAVLRTGVSRTR